MVSNHSAIEHRANYHFLKFEEDFLAVCRGLKNNNKQSAHCKALILAVLEHWTNDRLSKEKDGYVYMTYAQWEESIYGCFGRTSIIACLAELLKERLISKRTHPLPDGKVTFAYALNIPLLQKKLRALPERPDRPSRPKLDASKTECVQNETRSNLNASGVQKRTMTRPKTDDDPSKTERFLDSDSPDSLIDSDDRDSDSDDVENGSESENEEAPGGAVGLSSFSEKLELEEETPPPPPVSDQITAQREAWFAYILATPFSPELVQELATYYLPPLPLRQSKEKRAEALQKLQDAAEKLTSAPELCVLSPERAKQRLALLLCFITDPTSPSWYAQDFPELYGRDNLRLWHLANRSFEIGNDLDKSGWQPESDDLLAALQAACRCGDCWECRIRQMRETQQRSAHDPEPAVTPEVEPARIVEAVLSTGCDPVPEIEEDLATEEPSVTTMSPTDSAMSFDVCMALLDQVHEERPGYFVSHGKLRNGEGYIIHVHHSPGEPMALLRSPGDWAALLDELASRPKLTFAERRARAKRRLQEAS